MSCTYFSVTINPVNYNDRPDICVNISGILYPNASFSGTVKLFVNIATDICRRKEVYNRVCF